MPRGPNSLEPLEIAFTVNEQTGWYLDRMIEMGVFGNTRREAAKIALYDHCKLLVAQEKMKMAPPIPGSGAITIKATDSLNREHVTRYALYAVAHNAML